MPPRLPLRVLPHVFTHLTPYTAQTRLRTTRLLSTEGFGTSNRRRINPLWKAACFALGIGGTTYYLSPFIRSNSHLQFFSDDTLHSIHMRAESLGIIEELRANAKCTELDPHSTAADPKDSNFISGACKDGEAVAYQRWFAEGANVTGVVYFGHRVAGIPTMVHGGLIMSLVSETIAKTGTARYNDVGSVSELKVNYKRPTRVGQFVVFRSKLVEVCENMCLSV